MTVRDTLAAAVIPVPELPPAATNSSSQARRKTMADPLNRTAAALAANTLVTSTLGFAFWLVASHRYSTRQVGVDSALLSSMLLLSSVTELNFSTALPRLLPQVRSHRARIVGLCYLATGLAGIVAATAFALVVPHFVANLRFLIQSNGLILTLIFGLVMFNIFAVQDAVLVATRWAMVVPIENAAFGIVKLALMVILVGRAGGHGVFVSWLIATVLLVLPVNTLLFRRVLRAPANNPGEQTLLPVAGSRRKLVSYLAHDWLAGLLGQGTADALPLVVLAMLGRTVTAYFYIAFVIATAVASLAQSLTTSLLVEAAHDESALNQLARRTIARSAMFISPCVLGAMILAPLGLRLFGTSYAANAGGVLRLLLLATIPQMAVAIAMSIERIRGRAHRVVRLQAVTAVIGLALVPPLIRIAGVAGVGWAWLIAQSIAGFLAIPTIRSVVTSMPVRSGATQ